MADFHAANAPQGSIEEDHGWGNGLSTHGSGTGPTGRSEGGGPGGTGHRGCSGKGGEYTIGTAGCQPVNSDNHGGLTRTDREIQPSTVE